MDSIKRRTFLKTGTVAAAAFTVMKPQTVFGSEENSKIKLGMIGCGGRGTWIAGLFQEQGGYEIAACADYFEDRSNSFGDKFDIPKSKRFTGLAGYKRLLEKGDIDAIAIESPPYFHPEQAAAGVAAGKHVYLAKPIAVDVPGCQTIEQSAKAAAAKNLVFLVDFQTRADEFFIEAMKRTHEGALGELAFGESFYHAGIPWGQYMQYLEKAKPSAEDKLRAWGMDRVLSGDIITEQNIHTLDVMSWIMNETPLFATGTGGRSVRPLGNCYDHFTCLYQYSNNVGVTFSSRQFNGHGTNPEGIRNRMFGSEGILETEYGGQVIIRGNNFYRGGKSPGIYKDGANTNIVAFHKAVMEGDYSQPTVTPSVMSNMVTILGRTAAYEGETVHWYQLIKDTNKWEYDLSGLTV